MGEMAFLTRSRRTPTSFTMLRCVSVAIFLVQTIGTNVHCFLLVCQVIAANQASLVRPSGPPELLLTSENSTSKHGLALIAEEGLGLEDDEIAQAAESLALSAS